MSETITVTLPKMLSVEIKYHGVMPLELDKMGEDWFAWAIRNGVRQSVADADAGKAGTDEGKKAVLDKWTRIAEGKVPAQGAGGGKKADPETVASRTVVANVLHNSFGYGKTDAKKAAKDGDNPWFVLFAHYVRDEAKEAGEELDDDAIMELATDENLEAVKDMHKEEYKTALAVAKGGTKKVTTTGFLKK